MKISIAILSVSFVLFGCTDPDHVTFKISKSVSGDITLYFEGYEEYEWDGKTIVVSKSDVVVPGKRFEGTFIYTVFWGEEEIPYANPQDKDLKGVCLWARPYRTDTMRRRYFLGTVDEFVAQHDRWRAEELKEPMMYRLDGTPVYRAQ